MTTMKILTARYANPAVDDSYTAISISRGNPKYALDYPIADKLWLLAPPRELFGIESEAEFEAQYRAHLDKYGARKIHWVMSKVWKENGKRDMVLLCFEDIRKPGQWCHRTMFRRWWADKTGEDLDELDELEPVVATPLAAVPPPPDPQGSLF